MSAIPALMVRELFGIPVYDLGIWLTYISLALSLWSAKDYIVEFFKGLKRATEIRKEKKKARRKAKRGFKKPRIFNP